VKSASKPAPIIWRMDAKVSRIAKGRILRLEFLEPASVHWSIDNWATATDSRTDATGFGTFICDLPTRDPAEGAEVRFTIRWIVRDRWDSSNFAVVIGE
jgi:glucoamylase